MATEKILNTRIQLKYDSFAEWSSKNPTLKAGEVAIAYLTTAGAIKPGTGDTQHPVMFKVGPGAFNDLPWVSALAADVHSWAKKSEADFKAWVKGLIEVTDIDAYNKAEVDNLLSANSTADQAHADSVAATAKSEAIAAAASDAQSKVDALKNGEVKANADAIDAIKDHDSVDSFADVMTEMAKYQLAGDYATKAEAQGYADAKDAAIAEAKKAGTDANAALEAYKTSNNAAVALKADQTALDAVSAVANAAATQAALEAEIKRAQVAEKANADAITLLTDGVDQDKVDGVKDLIKYVEDHGPEVTGMKEDIAENAQAIADEASRADAEEKRLAGLIGTNAQNIQKNADAIAALNVADGKVANATKADIASSLDDAAVAQVKEIVVNEASNADTLDGHDSTYFATAEQGAKADTAVQPAALNDYYTKTAADAEFMNEGEVDAKIAALNLANTYDAKGAAAAAETAAKAHADGLAVNYATAAQGAKADSALQEITTTANGGLKVTNKNQIDIDTDVVFVFNCGSSSSLVD